MTARDLRIIRARRRALMIVAVQALAVASASIYLVTAALNSICRAGCG